MTGNRLPVTGHRDGRSRRCRWPSLAPVACRSLDFTLIELLTVLTILILMVALAAPAFTRQYHTAQLNSAGRNLLALMRYARTQAVVEGKTYRLNLDQENGRLWVTYYDEQRQKDTDPSFVPDESVLGSTRTLPEGVVLRQIALGDEALQQLSDEAQAAIQAQQSQLNGEGTPFITFHPQGTTDGARVLLENDDQDQFEVSLDAVTGRAQIEEATETAGSR